MCDRNSDEQRNISVNNSDDIKKRVLPPYEQLDDDIANIELEYLNEGFNITSNLSDKHGILSFLTKKNDANNKK